MRPHLTRSSSKHLSLVLTQSFSLRARMSGQTRAQNCPRIDVSGAPIAAGCPASPPSIVSKPKVHPPQSKQQGIPAQQESWSATYCIHLGFTPEPLRNVPQASSQTIDLLNWEKRENAGSALKVFGETMDRYSGGHSGNCCQWSLRR